jgi:hypothetical protein
MWDIFYALSWSRVLEKLLVHSTSQEITRLLWNPKCFALKMTVFWGIVPCNVAEIYGRFRGTYELHHQGNESSSYSSPWEAEISRSLPSLQEPATSPCPEPDESNPHSPTLFTEDPFYCFEVTWPIETPDTPRCHVNLRCLNRSKESVQIRDSV